jgi:hypothetical protein
MELAPSGSEAGGRTGPNELRPTGAIVPMKGFLGISRLGPIVDVDRLCVILTGAPRNSVQFV